MIDWLVMVASAVGAVSVYDRAPRLWVGDGVPGPTEFGGEWIELNAEQFHYVSRVMRLRDGDVVRVFGEMMGEYAASLEFRGTGRRASAWLSPLKSTRAPPCPQAPLELVFAPLRKKRTSLLVEKAVELGATALRAVRTEFTEKAAVAALGDEPISPAAVEAAEQSERLRVPLLYAPVPLRDLRLDVPLYVCLEREPGRPHLLDAASRARPGGIAVLVGPEGGFSDRDLADLELSVPTAKKVSLGPNVLRAETAAIAAVAILAALRDRRS
ncbi:hypothetical protein CTAYLR_003398 [Chrysophaeum taylorii]|uniref:16S rRNA (uracil(1498)-N(3))-methyltransferase n=1 Tax=Chrysophaeum taylorii TaxID=2483200 RepID=A0AAD7XFW2_9STRA|nr:hypothetical protein CTAYLR_003398 [Chrysophaeum taylorii]